MRSSGQKTSIRRILAAYRKAARSSLHVGFRYVEAEQWDAQSGTQKSIICRHEICICSRAPGQYYIDTGSLDSGPLSRSTFRRLLYRYASLGFREMTLAICEHCHKRKRLAGVSSEETKYHDGE